jgi:ankyrin repeat protein
MFAPSHALQKRKLAKIRLIFDEHDLEKLPHGKKVKAGISEAWMVLTFVVLIVLFAITIAMLRKRLHKGLSYLYARLRYQQRHLVHSLNEKEKPEHLPAIEASGASSSLNLALNLVAKRRAGIPDAAHMPNNIWEMAAQGQLNETRTLKAEQEEFDVNKVHPRYGTLLAAAARSGNVDLVSYVLTLDPHLQTEGGQYHNALQSGAASGNSLVVRRLLDVGARDSSVGGYFGTALNAAAERATSETLVALLNYTSHPARWVNEPGGLHGRALIAAASRGQIKMVKDLLAHGADVNGANEAGETALHAAASAKHLQIVAILLERGANKDLLSLAHGTALHMACRGSSNSIALLLISQGASTNVLDQNKRTALDEASKSGLVHVVEAILARDRSTINNQDADNNTALHHAAISGHSRVVEILIEHKIDVSLGDKFQAQALFRAAGCRHPEVVKVLLEKGNADPNATDSFGQTALHGPAETEDVSVQQLLIKADANINARGAWNRTPLHEACNMARYNNVKLLLSRPEIDVNVVDDSQTTPLSRSLSSTDGRYQDQCVDKRIPMLILDYKEIDSEDFGNGLKPDVRKGVDVNLCNGLAIQEAARRNLIDVVRKMITEHRANIHVAGGRYGGVLHAAAMGGDVELLNLLLKQKVNVNLQGGEYGTPLAAAAAFGNAAAVETLIENGADATIQGVGRYGSAYKSVCRALNVNEEGHFKLAALTSQIQGILIRAGGSDVAATPRDLTHLKDRWQLMPNGYGWNAAGEL